MSLELEKWSVKVKKFFLNNLQVKIIFAGEGKLRAELKIAKKHSNQVGSMAGGMACTLVDAFTALAAMTTGEDSKQLNEA